MIEMPHRLLLALIVMMIVAVLGYVVYKQKDNLMNILNLDEGERPQEEPVQEEEEEEEAPQSFISPISSMTTAAEKLM
jgi:hypothetical protein